MMMMMLIMISTTILMIAEGSSSQAPNLQPSGKENGGAIRGILGDCNEDLAMYHAFVSDESYYCDLADTAYKSFKSKYYPDTDLCDWGFGELIPRPYTDPITGDKHWQAPVRFLSNLDQSPTSQTTTLNHTGIRMASDSGN